MVPAKVRLTLIRPERRETNTVELTGQVARKQKGVLADAFAILNFSVTRFLQPETAQSGGW